MTLGNMPWRRTSPPVYERPVNYLWKVTNAGLFFHDFYVEGETYSQAEAHAKDALAGSATRDVGKRFYGTVDQQIKSITKTGVVVQPNDPNDWNYHNTHLVMLDTNREDETT